MSRISERVRAALYSAMDVSGVTSLATGGIHHQLAPETASMPYVVFQRQASSDVVRAFKNNLIAENDLWLVKAVSDEDSSTVKEPQQLNEDILEAVEAAIGTELTLASGGTWDVERVSDIPEYTETVNDRLIFHNGFLLRVWAY